MADFDGRIIRVNPATRADGVRLLGGTHVRDVVDRDGVILTVGGNAETTKTARIMTATHVRDVVDRNGSILQVGDD